MNSNLLHATFLFKTESIHLDKTRYLMKIIKKGLLICFLFLCYINSYSATYTVTVSTDNAGGINPNPGDLTGTLRQAIVDANAAGGTNTINFTLGTSTITLLANLPALNSNITIDGGSKTVSITSGVSGATSLIEIAGSNCIIKGLIFLNAAATGTSKLIYISAGSGNTIQDNYIGTNGITAQASNAMYGIYISSSPNNVIENNVISGVGNYGYGVYITGAGATGNVVKGNIIGLQANGTSKMTHFQKFGICITGGAGLNTIGGTGASDGNTISGQYGQLTVGAGGLHNGAGVLLNGNALTGNIVIGNKIGMQSNGNTYVNGKLQAFCNSYIKSKK